MVSELTLNRRTLKHCRNAGLTVAPLDLVSLRTCEEPFDWHTWIFSIEGFRTVLSETPFQVERVVASPSGNASGLLGLIQACATTVATVGFSIAGESWPFVLGHIFVCRRGNVDSGVPA